jgi:competence protein ComEC
MDHPFRGQAPAIWLAVPFLAGLVLGLASGPAGGGLGAILILPCLLSAAFRLPPLATASALMALCGMLTAARVPFVDPSKMHPLLDREVMLRGTVESMKTGEFGWSGVVRGAVLSPVGGSASVRAAKVFFSVRSPDSAVSFPAEVRATGRIRPVRSRGNPGEVPREWSALARGVQYSFGADASRTVFLPQADAGGLKGRLRLARARTGRWLAAHAGNSSGARYLRTLATGEAPPPGDPLPTLLRRTGLAHLLAISGLHVGVFFAIGAFLARCALWLVRRRRGFPDLNGVSALASLPLCWAYVMMAGAPVSAVRAAGMITAAVLAWRGLGVRGAGAAWTAMFLGTIFSSPLLAFSPSFLLSYGATFFLIASIRSDPSRPAPGTLRRRALRCAGSLLVASTVAFSGTLPVSAAFFGALPAGAILWNLLFAGPLGAAGVFGAFLSAVGGVFSVDALGPPVRVLAALVTLLLEILRRVSGDGAGYVSLPPAGVAAPFLCTAGAAAGAIFLLRRGRRPWPAAVAGAAAFLAWIHLPYAALPAAHLTVAALNLGRGAAHLVSFPGGGHMLVDCGSRLHGDAGRRIVLPFLRKNGVRRIDVLVLTHPHEDHYGGAEAVLREIEVGEIWIPQGTSAAAFGREVGRRAGAVRERRAGDVHAAGGVEVLVRASGGGAGRVNDQSLVLEIRHGPLSVWMPGDVEGGAAVWGAVAPANGQARVLFLPHHGSPGAKPLSWIRAASPKVVVAQRLNSDCAGLDNLVTSAKFFYLENGAFSVQSDGASVFARQDGGSRFWSLLLRLPRSGGAGLPGYPARSCEWPNNES